MADFRLRIADFKAVAHQSSSSGQYRQITNAVKHAIPIQALMEITTQ
jgi:hypothetical protein